MSPPADLEATVSPLATPALTPLLGLTNFALVAAVTGTTAVLLPNQLTGLDPANKVNDLALISSVSLVLALITQPIVGLLSDRTRSRFGRRTPWMFVGGLLMAASLAGLGVANSLALILVLAAAMQLGLGTINAPLAAILADRYPPERRTAASAYIGLGINVGYAVGVLIAGLVAADLRLAYIWFGIGLVIVVVAICGATKDSASSTMRVGPVTLRAVLSGFWIDPRRHPDFAWGFVTRFLFVLANFVAASYQLYILTDFIGLSLEVANGMVGILGVLALLSTIAAGYVTGWLARRIGRLKIQLYLSCGFVVAGYLIQVAAPSMAGQYAMVAIVSFGIGIYLTADAAVMTQVLPDADGSAAKGMGILNLAMIGPQAVSAALAAAIIGIAGYRGLFVAGSVICVLGALAAGRIRRVR